MLKSITFALLSILSFKIKPMELEFIKNALREGESFENGLRDMLTNVRISNAELRKNLSKMEKDLQKEDLVTKREKGLFSFNGGSYGAAPLVKAVINVIARTKTVSELKEIFPVVKILNLQETQNRKIIATVKEHRNFTENYKERYFPVKILDVNGEEFYMFSEWGRYVNQRGGVKTEGNIYKFIREVKKLGIKIKQVSGENYEGK
jgi:hypothetical protein